MKNTPMIPPMVKRVASTCVFWLKTVHQHPGRKGQEQLLRVPYKTVSQ